VKKGLSLFFLAALVALFGAGAAGVVAQSRADPVDIAKSIMSPVCPGRLISNCPSPEAEQLREIIRRQVAEGKTKQQVIDYFVEVYGPSVLPSPPQEGFFLTAWYLPLAVILSGGGILLVLVRVWTRGHEEERASAETDEPVTRDPSDQKYARILDEELKDFDA
jgi:cytochrome c-type biogenesis protein CcmH